MKPYRRYAIYYTPPPGPFADFGAAWLGWDADRGRDCERPASVGPDMGAITDVPRRYGFHATLKPPFRLAAGADAGMLRDAVAAMADDLCAVTLPGLELSRIGPFLALVPQGDVPALTTLAGEVVRRADAWRAPASADEIARRNPDQLDTRGRMLLARWGYPWVMERFRFHMTLSGPLDAATAARAEAVLAPMLAVVPRPFCVDALSLAGEDDQGRFHVLSRFSLRAPPRP
ncbi:MAG: DUF1045 domain-containing protein [Paracoccus sp. (in: a-proteobacteria)]|nr:DUF1045 domain-containing protein [Paracoccus sp. (in: a-proteobacteria)]